MHNVPVTGVPAGARIIDVREPDEFAAGHARGAENIPLSQLEDRLEEAAPTGDTYLICARGGRSAQAYASLASRFGDDHLRNVEGGTEAWAARDLPME